MAVTAIDTHEAVKEFLGVGFTDEQAEVLVARLRQVQDLDLSRFATKDDLANLATKADLAELRVSTKADMAELRLSTKADMAELKAEILKWMFGTMGVQTIVIIGAVVALVRSAGH